MTKQTATPTPTDPLASMRAMHENIAAEEAARINAVGERPTSQRLPWLTYLKSKCAAWEAAGGDPAKSPLAPLVADAEAALAPPGDGGAPAAG